MSVDPLAGSTDNPQSLHRYVYVLNDPINLVGVLKLVWFQPPRYGVGRAAQRESKLHFTSWTTSPVSGFTSRKKPIPQA